MTSPFGGPDAPTAFEAWVRQVRAWADDPRVSLADLPPLSADRYSPDTFARLFKHIAAAIEAVDRRWHDALSRAWSTSPNAFELGQRLIELRSTLGRRVQLAGHPGLPEEAREILMKKAREDVERYQRELEEAVSSQRTMGRVDIAEVEKMVMLVRTNSFLRVFDFELRQDGARLEAAPLPIPPPDAQPSSAAPWRTRRVVVRPEGE